MIVPVGIALGSNLGNRAEELAAGFQFLSSLSIDGKIRTSGNFETEPVGCAPGTPSFLNAVAWIEIDARKTSPRELLQELQTFEVTRGRTVQREPNVSRPLDLDILFFGSQLVNEPGLVIPHPRATQRVFVLRPLVELQPDLILPGQTLTVEQLLDRLTSKETTT